MKEVPLNAEPERTTLLALELYDLKMLTPLLCALKYSTKYLPFPFLLKIGPGPHIGITLSRCSANILEGNGQGLEQLCPPALKGQTLNRISSKQGRGQSTQIP